MPIPSGNIIQTEERPGRNTTQEPLGGLASQLELKEFMSSKLQTKYGSFSSIASNKPNATFVFIVDDSGSMTYDETVKYAFENGGGIVEEIEIAGLRCIVLTSCNSERWLQWTRTVLTNITTLIDNYETNPSLPFTQFSFCEGCESVSWYTFNGISKVSLSLQNRTLTGYDGYESWEINAINAPSTMPQLIGDWSYYEYNGNPYGDALSQTIRVYLRCVNGILLLDAVSTRNDTRGFVNGEPQKLQRYYWDNIEIPVNASGLPFGSISLPTPDYLCVFDSNEPLEANSACYEVPLEQFLIDNINVCIPVTPEIVFIIDDIDSNTPNDCNT